MEFQMMARTDIQPSPLNPRKYFDEGDLRELADTMGNGVGIIEPLVVRPRPDLNCYELIAGERRWRASAIAGLDTVPVVVKPLADAQVIEQMLIENGARKNINPLEEGEGYKLALKLGAFASVDELAAHVGKSRRYVYDHLKLVDDLVDEAKELLARGVISGSHAVLLTRLTAEQQTTALDPEEGGVFEDPGWDSGEAEAAAEADERPAGAEAPLKPRSVRELESWVSKRYRFDPSSRVARDLFPETVSAVEAAERVVHITYEPFSRNDADDGGRILPATHWRRADGVADSQRCDHSVLGVVVLGPGRGRAFAVCTDKKRCALHWPQQPQRAGGRATSAGDPRVFAKSGRYVPKSQLAAENAKHEAEQRQAADARERYVAALPAICDAVARKMATLAPTRLVDLVIELAAGALDGTRLDAVYARLKAKKRDAPAALAALALLAVLGEAENKYSGPYEFPEFAKERLGLDLGPFLKPVQTSAPAAQKGAPVRATKKKSAPVAKKATAVTTALKKKRKAS